MVRPAALSAMSCARRRARVSSRLALITQWVAVRRYQGLRVEERRRLAVRAECFLLGARELGGFRSNE